MGDEGLIVCTRGLRSATKFLVPLFLSVAISLFRFVISIAGVTFGNQRWVLLPPFLRISHDADAAGRSEFPIRFLLALRESTSMEEGRGRRARPPVPRLGAQL